MLADDEASYRGAVRELIDATPDLTVVGVAETGREAIAVAGASRPDVVLMDVRMPDGDGIAATARLTAGMAPLRILVLTTFDVDDHVFRALRAGASGFLLRDVPPPR
nr:response regulator transcription factor [Cryptosporangium arvum]